MKKTFFMLLGAALMVVAGCKKDDNKLNNGEKMTFTSDLSGGAKTEISGKLMKWTEGDQIVINGKTFSSTISQEGAFATFTGDAVEPTYHAYYPASLYDNGNYVLPATQTYNGTNLSLVNPMYASSENTTLQFHNICALVKLDLTGTEKVKTIVAQAEKPLSGAFTVKEENGTFYAELSSKDAATVTLNCGDGVQLNATTPTTFYMALPQGTYENLAFTVSNGTKSTVVDAANATLEAGHIWNKIAEVSFIPIIPAPAGALPGLFSVSDDKQVWFSKGNLQYVKNGEKWQFATTQYEIVEQTGQSVGKNYANAPVQTLFGWGDLIPLRTDDDTYSWTDDWGIKIGTGWRTLSGDEWNHLINTRKVKGETGFGKTCQWVKYNNVEGLIIYPDVYDGELYGLGQAIASAEFPDGCVFLPAAGHRSIDWSTFIYESIMNVGTFGRYWSTSPYELNAKMLSFDNGSAGIGSAARRMGYSVRLVYNY